MSINKDLLDQLMESRNPGDLFGKGGIIQELTKALAERTLRRLIFIENPEGSGNQSHTQAPPAAQSRMRVCFSARTPSETSEPHSQDHNTLGMMLI
jgi:hypothetical protein